MSDTRQHIHIEFYRGVRAAMNMDPPYPQHSTHWQRGYQAWIDTKPHINAALDAYLIECGHEPIELRTQKAETEREMQKTIDRLMTVIRQAHESIAGHPGFESTEAVLQNVLSEQ